MITRHGWKNALVDVNKITQRKSHQRASRLPLEREREKRGDSVDLSWLDDPHRFDLFPFNSIRFGQIQINRLCKLIRLLRPTEWVCVILHLCFLIQGEFSPNRFLQRKKDGGDHVPECYSQRSDSHGNVSEGVQHAHSEALDGKNKFPSPLFNEVKEGKIAE